MKRIIIFAFVLMQLSSFAQGSKWNVCLSPSFNYTYQEIKGGFLTDDFSFSSVEDPRPYGINYDESFSFVGMNLDLEVTRNVDKWALGLAICVDSPLQKSDFLAENGDFRMNLVRGTNYSMAFVVKRKVKGWDVFARAGMNLYSGFSVEADLQKDGFVDWHDHNFGGIQLATGIERQITNKLILKSGVWFNQFKMSQAMKDGAQSNEDIKSYSVMLGLGYRL